MIEEQNKNPLDEKSWKLLEKTLQISITEQRRSRRWGIFFKLLTFLYLFILLAIGFGAFKKETTDTGPHSAVIKISGAIGDKEEANANDIISALHEAYKDPNTKGVILNINSPGGSPVQSAYVYDEITRLRTLHPDIPVYAVISDIGASGAYYIASAADKIYANQASLVGSIGVTAAGFGFVDIMHKVGVERRAYTSGAHKAFLDPFQPMKEDETAFWTHTLDIVHQQFIDSVKKGRGDRLKDKDNPDLFSGLIWTGKQALDLGLIDGFGSTNYVADTLIEAKIKDYTKKDSIVDRFAKKIGASAAQQLGLSANQAIHLQ